MKKYIVPQIRIASVLTTCILTGSDEEPGQVDGGLAKRHNSNDFWSDMESTSSSWPKSKSVWDD